MTNKESGLVPFQSDRGLLSLRDAMNQLFDESFWSPLDRAPFGRLSTAMTAFPKVDVAEREDAIIVTANVPGMKPEDISVEVHDGILTLSGESKREEKKEDKEKRYHRIEREYGSFSRSFSLPMKIDEQKVEAETKDGVLTVTLPKSKEEEKKRIAIKVR